MCFFCECSLLVHGGCFGGGLYGLRRHIESGGIDERNGPVDLVESGATLKANGLMEVETIMEVSSRLIVNRTAFKTRGDEVRGWVQRFREAVDAA